MCPWHHGLLESSQCPPRSEGSPTHVVYEEAEAQRGGLTGFALPLWSCKIPHKSLDPSCFPFADEGTELQSRDSSAQGHSATSGWRSLEPGSPGSPASPVVTSPHRGADRVLP